MTSTISTKNDKSIKKRYYYGEIDFEQLAVHDTAWRALYDSGSRVDWQDAKTVQCACRISSSPFSKTDRYNRALTRAIARVDFDLTLILPSDRLCPPVPVRWNYIRWLEDLLVSTNYENEETERDDEGETVTGLDIGVGASCIYPLLACATHPSWRMLGTDIDDHSLSYASQNVSTNGFDDRIKLKKTENNAPLIPLDSAGIEEIDFVMCNPPFYSSEDDMARAYDAKTLPPIAVCTGAPNEMICPDGDIGFATRIFEESLRLRTRVRWYSCMLGRLTSAQQLVAKLKANDITNFAVTNLKAGQKTARWAVAWSCHDRRPANGIARHGDLVLAILPPTTERTIHMDNVTAPGLSLQINTKMQQLDLRWSWQSETYTGTAVAEGNVWSRSARRRKQHHQVIASKGGDREMKDHDAEQAVALAVRIRCQDYGLQIRWLRGHDPVLFESFIGMIKTTLGLRFA